MYDLIQSALTVTINVIAIAGFSGIVAHALYKWHLAQIPTAPKANPDYQRSELVDEILETLRTEVAQAKVSEYVESLEDDGLRGEYGVEVVEEVEAEEETAAPQHEIDLNSLDAVTLRKLCTQHQIGWRNFRGANRHMPKATMIFNLQQCLTA
jgi:hypothetical protein